MKEKPATLSSSQNTSKGSAPIAERTAAAVAVSGVIGWVGLVIPHLTRRIVGNNYRHLIPASSLFGAVFLLMVDNLSRNMFATEIPIGILTSFIGAPFFLYLITREGERL